MSLILDVKLDPTANPPVIISNRDVNAEGQVIRWRKASDATIDFDFERLDELDQVYFPCQSIDEDRKRVRCNNRAPTVPMNPPDYPYTIVVKSGGITYDSTRRGGGQPQDKPVIRN